MESRRSANASCAWGGGGGGGDGWGIKWACPVVRCVAAIVAGVLLEGRKVQERVATDEALQLCPAEQVDGWAAQQLLEASGKGLKLRRAHNMHRQASLRPSRQESEWLMVCRHLGPVLHLIHVCSFGYFPCQGMTEIVSNVRIAAWTSSSWTREHAAHYIPKAAGLQSQVSLPQANTIKDWQAMTWLWHAPRQRWTSRQLHQRLCGADGELGSFSSHNRPEPADDEACHQGASDRDAL